MAFCYLARPMLLGWDCGRHEMYTQLLDDLTGLLLEQPLGLPEESQAVCTNVVKGVRLIKHMVNPCDTKYKAVAEECMNQTSTAKVEGWPGFIPKLIDAFSKLTFFKPKIH